MMRRITLTAVAAVSAVLLLSVAACTPNEPDNGPTSATETTTGANHEDPPTTEAPPAFDPASVDLANTTWTWSSARHTEPPITVELTDGVGEGFVISWDGRITYNDDAQYIDLDGDGDLDVVASLDFEADAGDGFFQWVISTWYFWINTGEELVQMPYNIEMMGDCSDGLPTITAAADHGIQVEQMVMSSTAVCAEGAQIPVSRQVVVQYDEAGQPWPIQTAPVVAWGGECPGQLGGGDGPVLMSAAPGFLDAGTGDVQVAQIGLEPSWLDTAFPGTVPSGIGQVGGTPEDYWCGWQ